MNPCAPFARRPVATGLLALGLLLVGLVSYRQLPVASLPNVDLPTIRVSASRPGADPETMASTVAAPLERRLGAIAGVTEITSVSGVGSTSITLQFAPSRRADAAAGDVQAALNAAAADLPSDLPTLPSFRKANPAAAPILILAITSPTLPTTALYDAAETVLVQRLSQVEGVGDVTVSGAEQPAVRVEIDPRAAAQAGLTLEQVRQALVAANPFGPLGAFEGARQSEVVALNGQLARAADYDQVLVRARNGTVVRLTDVARVSDGVRNTRAAGTYDGRPAVILTVTKAAEANVVETARRVRALLPTLERWVPADVRVDVMSDRTTTIEASLDDMRRSLGLSVGLVMIVVVLFLGGAVPALAAGVVVPLAFAGTFAGMWAFGLTIDNLSLMAMAVAVGFVVDDAIVVVEAVVARVEAGMEPMEAAIEGAGSIAFTVITIGLSLVAAFLPLIFLEGIVGRFFQAFALTVTFAVAASTVVALTVTPALLAHALRPAGAAPRARGPLARGFARLRALSERGLTRLGDAYAATLAPTLRRPGLMLFVTLATVGLTVLLFIKVPKGYFPQDDSGLLIGFTEASPDVSFEAMRALQERAATIVAADPAVAHVGSFIGASGWIASVNNGRLFVALKAPRERGGPGERGGLAAPKVVERLREPLRAVPGMSVYLVAAQDVRAGGRGGRSDYQFTLWSADLASLRAVAPKVAERLRAVPGLTDVSTDQEAGGLQADVVIDRAAAARLGVAVSDIDAALNNAFAQRQVATIFAERNQYRVVMSAPPAGAAGPEALARVFVPARGGAQVPLSSVATLGRSLAPLVVNHQGQFASVTVGYALVPGASLGEVTPAIRAAVAGMALPEGVNAQFAGDAAAFEGSANSQGLLILGALLAIYILLGVLYESLAHPLTILSTLPSAGLGALLALVIGGLELTLVALIGIILLIGIVKKNGILLVDHALAAQRGGMSPAEAIAAAARERFRPILMTTIAAMLGALPLAFGEGPGAELRRPLGLTVLGGLLVSQVLTLYTTPALYLGVERLRGLARRAPRAPALAPAE